MNEAEIRKLYHVFFKPGEVVELRALGCGGKSKLWEGFARQEQGVFGYFDNAEDFARAARDLDNLKEPPHGIYFTLNPPQPAVMARAHNRLVAVNKKRPCTSDKEIRCSRWLPVDLDVSKAIRPAGISSSQEELDLTKEAGSRLLRFLTEDMGFPDPVKGMGGEIGAGEIGTGRDRDVYVFMSIPFPNLSACHSDRFSLPLCRILVFFSQLYWKLAFQSIRSVA